MEKLKTYNLLKRVRRSMQNQRFTEAYSCLLEVMDKLEEDLLYRDAKKDWHAMNEEIQRDRHR